MSKGRKRNKNSKKVLNPQRFTYAQALEMTGNARTNLILPYEPLQPGLAIGTHTQAKLMSIITIMTGIGKLPGDFPKNKFDEPITYRKLSSEGIEWLEKAHI